VELHKNGIGFHEVSYERRRWPKKTVSLIEKAALALLDYKQYKKQISNIE